MVSHIDHIGIAVRSLKKSIVFCRDVLQLPFEGTEIVEEQGVTVAFFRIGESRIELLEPLNEQSPVYKFLEKRGEGFHHFALGCKEIEKQGTRLQDNKIRMLSEEPKEGAHNKKVWFMHPKDTAGVLFELTQSEAKEDKAD